MATAEPRCPNRGFTLIELLIVVAIIAILAAIAVPNFLEAQVRSKVSRTKADMRTVATALEAYAVDSNHYPPDFHGYTANPNAMPHNSGIRYNTLLARLLHLTTPISYISNLPQDFFAEGVASGAAGITLSGPYKNTGTSAGVILRPIVYDYAKFDNGLDNPTIWAQISSNPSSVRWALNSPGPDISSHFFLGTAGLVIYDPTNGTVSVGQIIRTNISAEDNPQQ